MPLFDYYCKECEAIWEVMVTLNDLEKEIECPDCKEKLVKMLSAPAVRIH